MKLGRMEWGSVSDRGSACEADSYDKFGDERDEDEEDDENKDSEYLTSYSHWPRHGHGRFAAF